ncbi:hypothetical protein [Novosphingobium sp. Gsoil 351]|uniref:hypothetical protein n=1 Tax=Novosphingobium sp. Gsoil 351 TaxID=2675225 RepID=UPI0012B48F60|nr:hypothetical protein [Novosphingobium sp. Gsoil 351]QGN55362.1 hypothetical protein GKE62_13210 [Novosphingobium sp. Gsoil 351]
MTRLLDPRLFRQAFYAAAIFSTVTALASPSEFGPRFPYSDKVQHFAVFAVLATLAWFGFTGAPRRLIVERLSFLGAAIEVLQSIPALHRDCDVLDWATDTAAAVVVVLLLAWLAPGRRIGRTPVEPG